MRIDYADVQQIRRIAADLYEITYDLHEQYLDAYRRAVIDRTMEIVLSPEGHDPIVLSFIHVQPLGEEVAPERALRVQAMIKW